MSNFAADPGSMDPVLIYTSEQPFVAFSPRQIKDHFGLLYLRDDQHHYEFRVPKQRIEFEREKLRKLKEVYQIAVDKTQNCRFFVRDFLEYVRKVLAMQLNVVKIVQEERLLIREKGFATGRLEGLLSQKIEGVERAMFVLCVTEPGESICTLESALEARLLQTLLPMQVLNNKYRKDLRQSYDISEEFEEELMNNKLYGCLTDGVEWIFLVY